MLRNQRKTTTADIERPPARDAEGFDLSELNVSELETLQRMVGLRIETLKKENRRRAFEAVERTATEMGLSRTDLRGRYGNGGNGANPKKTVVRFRHPDTGQTWSGRGRKPDWLKEFEEQGGSPDSIAIEKET